MQLPFKGAFPLTQKFGVNPDSYKQFLVGQPDGTRAPMRGHNGLDFGTPHGTPIYAPHAGKVIEARFDEHGYGNYVKIESEKEGSVLAHLDSITVQERFVVAEGEQIGVSDNTGYSTAPHLHWGYYTIPRDRSNGYSGFIDQLPLLSTPQIEHPGVVRTKYKVGDEIKPVVDIPVGKNPGEESFSYGKVSQTAPAKITNAQIFNGQTYYNIDQAYIGGGTGWVRADVVDTIPDQTEIVLPKVEEMPAPVTGKLYTEKEYNDMALARDEYKLKYDEANAFVISFRAMGVEKVEDLEKKYKEYEKTIEGLTTELHQTLNRNKKLAEIVAEKEDEDSTAIEMGVGAVKELENVKQDVSAIAQATETKPSLNHILSAIDSFKQFKDLAEKTLNKATNEAQQGMQRTQYAKPKTSSIIDTFLQDIFGSKEVKSK